MFMRIRDIIAWVRHHAIAGPGCYMSGAVIMAVVSMWAFAQAMTVIIRATDLVQPRALATPVANAGLAASDAAAGRDETAKPLTAAEPEAARSVTHAQPPRTISNPAEDPNAMYVDGSDGDTYRTVCVRLCDGYFWPVSFATNRSNLVQDREICEKSCGTPVRLYIHRVPGGTENDLQDLAGQPYTRLKTAFRFRTTYDAACKCTAHPWEQEAKDRHRVHALENDARKGDRQAVAALATLKGKVEADKRQEQAQKKLANAQLVAAGVVSAASATAIGPPPSGRAARTFYSSYVPGPPQREERAMQLGGPDIFSGRGQGGGYGPLGAGPAYGGSGGGRGGGSYFGSSSGASGGSNWRAKAFGFGD